MPEAPSQNDSSPIPFRRAVLIGIDHYPLLAENYQLEGCVHDVELVRRALLAHGFDPEELVVLTEERATHEGIRRALEELTREAAEERERSGGEALLFVHYSGHGSRIRSQDKDAGWLESIVPADSGRGEHPNRDLSDLWIGDWLRRTEEVTSRLVVVFDSCHSGSVGRTALGALGVRERWVEPDPRPVALPEGLEAPGLQAGGRGLRGDTGHVLLAACGAREIAHEAGGKGSGKPAFGAFSQSFYGQLLSGAGGATYRDVFDLVRASVSARYPTQHPQLEGDGDQLLLGVGSAAAEPHLPVLEGWEDRVLLAGGAAQGVVAESRWAILPAATRSRSAAEPLAEVTVTEVGAVESWGRIGDGGGLEELPPGCRAFEVARPADAFRLPVALLPATAAPEGEEKGSGEAPRARLMAAIEGEPSLRPVASPGDAEVVVGAVEEAGGGAAWIVHSRDGSRLGSAHPLAGPESVEGICINLTRRARILQLLELAREGMGHLEVGLELLSPDSPEGLWETGGGGRGGREKDYRIGERMVFEISNRGGEEVFPYLFHLGADGEVSLLDPVPGGHEALAPGRCRRVGEGRRVFHATDSRQPGQEPPDELLVLFASSRQLDLDIFLQPGYRGAGSGDGSGNGGGGTLARRLEVAWHGLPASSGRGIETREVEAWGALVRRFRVLPPSGAAGESSGAG
ncbi:MAG: caspase family protein [Acidobacteriota bacterium]|nr:caspase family protein [Acidobacteriota bacterium]